jgi:hypothetical protein
VKAALAAAALALVPAAGASAPAWWDALGVRDISGSRLEPEGRWIVVVALGRECPVSNASLPELNHIARDFRGKGVALVGACVDPGSTRAELCSYASDYKVGFALADDGSQRLARAAGTGYTPEVAVFSADGRRLYLGAIDDRVGPGGAQKPSATRHYLRDVLGALVRGGRGPFEDHPGYGCALPEAVKP